MLRTFVHGAIRRFKNRLNLADTSDVKKYLVFSYIFLVGVGIWVSKSSWDRLVFVNVGSERAPSAFQGLRDFSALKGTPLLNAASDQVLDQIQMVKDQEGFRIEIHQFVMRDRDGSRNFSCRIGGRPGVFDRIEISLYGYGVSEHGKLPEMVIESDCLSVEKGDLVGPVTVFIPMNEISKLKSTNQQISLHDDLKSSVEIKNMTSVWPDEWRIEKVRYFQSSEGGESLALTPNHTGSESGAFSLRWEQPTGTN